MRRCLAVGVELVLGVLASELQVVAVVGVYRELHDVMPGAVLVLELVIVAVHLTVVAHLWLWSCGSFSGRRFQDAGQCFD